MSCIVNMMAHICHLWYTTWMVWCLRQSECDDIYSGSDGRQNGFQVRYRACVVIHTVCDIIYSGYYAINIVSAMTDKQRYDVIKRGCDVIYSAYGVLHAVGEISYIHSLWYHQSSVWDYRDTVRVMMDTVVVLSFMHHVRCHIHSVWCHKHRRCLVIDTVAVKLQA